MNLFLSDLDNTLIYSYKKDIGKEKVLVETKEGKELSFMTKKSIDILCELQKKLYFIPVTTRSVEQYQRIKFSSTWMPSYSLVANGGILLHHNKIVDQWYQDSLQLIESAEDELNRSIKILSEDKTVSFEIRRVDGLFVFTKSGDTKYTLARLREKLDLSLVDTFHNGSKVYVVPKVLNKGAAIARIRKKYKDSFVIAAGDSLFDVPMLERADLSFVPKNLEQSFCIQLGNRVVIEEGDIFSDVLLEYIHNKY